MTSQFQRILSVLLVVISIGHSIWLVLIPNGESSSILDISFQRLVLLATILFLCIPAWYSYKFPQAIRQPKSVKLFSFLSIVVFTSALLFFISPVSEHMFKINPASWQRLAPVVSAYSMALLSWLLWTITTIPQKEAQSQKSSNREHFIDFARAVFILLALGSHVFFRFGYERLFGDWQFIIKSITRFATPGFIIITGIMFELVYLRKAEKFGFKRTRQTLIIRSLQCYFAYFLTLVFEWIAGYTSLKNGLLAMVFLGPSNISYILKFYTAFLLLAIPVIWLRQKWGILPIALLPIPVWIGTIGINRLPWPSPENNLAFLTSIFIGKPNIAHFSVWHALTFMSIGMVLGYGIKRSKQANNWSYFIATLFGLICISLLVTAAATAPISIEQLIYNFANQYRTDHHIAYYGIGSACSMLLLFFFWIFRNQLNHRWLNYTITILGKDSLWAFGVGNSLIVMMPTPNHHPLLPFISTLAVIGATVLIIHFKNFLIRINHQTTSPRLKNPKNQVAV